MMLSDDLHKQISVLKDQNLLVVVEGEKDKNALATFGINNVITLNKPLFEIVELITEKTNECVLLTDLDGAGKWLYARLWQDLQRHGVKVNNTFRDFLFRETSLRQIEGLDHYARNLFVRAQ